MRKRVLVALVSAALLGGCGSGGSLSSPQPEQPQPEASAPASDATSSSPVESATDDGVIDALEIAGPRYAADVPDMRAVITDGVPSFPVTITDASGAQVQINSADRILTFDLYGTLTDTVIGLGLTDKFVGRSISDTQEALKDLPVVTYGSHDLNIEAVLDLDPDLILTNGTIGTPEIYGQLQGAGVTVVNFEHIPSLDSIGETIIAIGRTLGMEPQARVLADQTEQDLTDALAQVQRLSAATARAPRGIVLYVRGTAGVFFILGQEYGASDILTALGLADIAAESGITNLKPANAEALVSLDPELILAMKHGVESTGGVEGFLGRPGLAATTAGAKERLVIAGDNQLLAYGPRTPANLVALAEAIYLADE